jgi:stage II sporulation protein AA (anti-sigma F factor antagonist)
LEIFTKKKDNALIVEISGELDMHTVDIFKEKIITAMERNNLTHLILNLKKCSFIDSSGLGAILGRYRELDKKGGQIYLVGLKPSVKKVFTLAGMLKIMKEVDNENQALMELNEGGL